MFLIRGTNWDQIHNGLSPSSLSQVVSSLNPHSSAFFWAIYLTYHLSLCRDATAEAGVLGMPYPAMPGMLTYQERTAPGPRCYRVTLRCWSIGLLLLYPLSCSTQIHREVEWQSSWYCLSGSPSISVHKDHHCFLWTPGPFLARRLSLNLSQPGSQFSPDWFLWASQNPYFNPSSF